MLAVFSFRYDAHLVPGLIANLAPIVHGHVAWDDRSADAALSDEPTRRNRLLDRARQLGADWILAVDPDERFEDRLAHRLPEMLSRGPGTIWHFDTREMFTPTAYRSDGIWGGKTVIRLFPVQAAASAIDTALHGQWVADQTGYRVLAARVNIYHFRMASAFRRRMRRALYAAADPGRRFQAIGYDYLDDERGKVLDQIPDGRGYSPAFADDGGLWAPDPGEVGTPAPDPFEARLTFAGRSLGLPLGQSAALAALSDLEQGSPGDADLVHLSARTALRAGDPATALARADRLLARSPADLHAHLVRAVAAGRLGDPATAQDSLSTLDAALGPSPLLQMVRNRALPQTADFAAPNALWRRWVGGAATLTEGANVPAGAEMAVIVPGFQAQPALRVAVDSLLAQDIRAEIVVVNSGGGDLRGLLGPTLAHIRLIEVSDPLFVGAARNIGADASRAPLLACLAGDCTANPGWVAARLRAHRAGAAMVSSPVLPANPHSLTAIAAHFLRYGIRHPETAAQDVSHFGRSFARWFLDEVCVFPPGLRISEDGYLNRVADRLSRPVWAPDVETLHRDPTVLSALLQDERARGRRKADHAPLRGYAGQADAALGVAVLSDLRLQNGRQAIAAWSGLGPRGQAAAKAMQWLASMADRAGIAEALVRLGTADSHMANATALRDQNDPAALTQAEAAFALDTQDWRKALQLGQMRHQFGAPGAEAAFLQAQALAPAEGDPVAAVCALHKAQGDQAGALLHAEAAIARAPGVRRFWDLASDAALRLNQPERARAWRRAALALAPQNPQAHHRLAQAHQACGDALSQAFRVVSVNRLKDWQDRKTPAG